MTDERLKAERRGATPLPSSTNQLNLTTMYKTIYTAELRNEDTNKCVMRLTTTDKEKAEQAYKTMVAEMQDKGLEAYGNTHHTFKDGHFSRYCIFDDEQLNSYSVNLNDLEFIDKYYPNGTIEVTERIVRYFE